MGLLGPSGKFLKPAVGFRAKLYRFLDAQGGGFPGGEFFDSLIIWLIVLNILAFVLGTDEDLVPPKSQLAQSFEVFEFVSVIIFTVEYFLRIYAAPENPYLRRSKVPRVWHFFSFFPLIDFFAIFPYYLQLTLNLEVVPTSVIRVFRLLRLLRGEKYGPVKKMFVDVFHTESPILVTTGFATAVVWVLMASLMHFAEENHDYEVDDMTQAERFESVPSSLWYTGVLMTGDMPMIDFTIVAKFLVVAIIVFSLGLMALPAGVLSAGFADVLVAKRLHELKMDPNAQTPDDWARIQAEADAQLKCRQCRMAEAVGTRGQMYLFLTGQTPKGEVFEYVVFFAIIANITCFILGTEENIVGAAPWVPSFFNVVEVVTVLFFTVEYFGRAYASADDPKYGGSRVTYLLSFFAILDVLAVLPFYIELFTDVDTSGSTVLRIFRLVRVFKAEHYLEAFGVFSDVFTRNTDTIITTFLAGGIIWVFYAAMLYLTEKDNDATEGAFGTMFNSLFMCMIFLNGEWAYIDLTLPGRFVGLTLAVLSVAVFAIPVGIVASCFQEIIEERADQVMRRNKTEHNCAKCGLHVKSHDLPPLLKMVVHSSDWSAVENHE